jgi:cobalt/nickel transport system permease protein
VGAAFSRDPKRTKDITMISEPFAIGKSMIHRLDPRIRLSLAVLYSLVVALSYQFSVLIMTLSLSIILILISRVKIQEVLKRLVIVNALILFLWLVLPFTFKGEALTRIGSFAVYRPGVILIATMSFPALGHAMHRLRVPEKIVYLLLMTYRYIFVIEEEYLRLMRAAKIRGFRPGTNANTYRTYSYVIGMLFVRAAARAERVHQAMQCRGFKGKFYSLQEFQINATSWVFAIMMTAIIIGLIFMELSKPT